MKDRRVGTNGIELSCLVMGSGPPCVLLHGNRDRKEHFLALAAHLERRMTLYLLDLRGHGKSDKPADGYTVETFVDDVAGAIDELGLDAPVLLGHSLGASIAMMLGARHPERAGKLVLMGAAAAFKIGFKRPEFSRAEFREQLAETNRRAAPFFFRDEYPEVRTTVLSQWSAVEFDVHMSLIRLRHPDLGPIAPHIAQETLLVYGEQDRATPVADGETLARSIPNARLEVVSGAGHFVFMEEPAEVARRISAFLDGRARA